MTAPFFVKKTQAVLQLRILSEGRSEGIRCRHIGVPVTLPRARSRLLVHLLILRLLPHRSHRPKPTTRSLSAIILFFPTSSEKRFSTNNPCVADQQARVLRRIPV
ncbi:unnamed protein product [Ectocarpus sp. 12 AP-2014]